MPGSSVHVIFAWPLPSDIRSCRTVDTFKRHLKTHLFRPVLTWCHQRLYIHAYIRVICIAHINSKRVTMRFGRQTSKFSEIVWKCQMTVPAVVVLVEGRSTGGDRRLRRFCHPVCLCIFRLYSAIQILFVIIIIIIIDWRQMLVRVHLSPRLEAQLVIATNMEYR